MLLDRDEVQPCRACRVGAPGIPRREEIEPQTETRLNNGVNRSGGPTRRQVVPRKEHVSRLSGSGINTVIDVAVFGRVGRLAGIDYRRSRYYQQRSMQ